MSFKEWLKEIVYIDDIGFIKDSSYIGFREEPVLESGYEILKKIGMLECAKLYSIKDHEFKYVLAFDTYINVDNIFPIMKVLNASYYLDNLDENKLKDMIVGIGSIKNIDTDNFYVLMTLDHEVYNLKYIEQLEVVLNENITQYTNFDLLYRELKEAMKDPKFSSIVKSYFPSCSVMVFPTMEDLLEYKKFYIENEMDNISFDSFLDEMSSIIPNILNEADMNGATEVNVKAYDPDQGKVIDIGTYKKTDNSNDNKLN